MANGAKARALDLGEVGARHRPQPLSRIPRWGPRQQQASQHDASHMGRSRPILDKVLSGAESGDDVRQHVEAHVAKWRSERDRWWHLQPPSPQQVVKGIHTAKTVVEAVNKTPEFRQLADTVIQAIQTKLRQRRQAKEPPASPS